MARKSKQELEVAVRDYHIRRKPITLRQFKLALLERGLTAEAEAAIANMESPKKEKAEIEWRYASSFKRNDDWVEDMVAEMSVSSEDMDIIFYEALNK